MAMQSVTKASLAMEIRAIMDSTPDGLNSNQIENDYRQLVGKSLKAQVKMLGHNDIDSFLLILSDEGAVRLEHCSYGYLFKAGVADKSTAHIQALVKNQVSKSKKGGKGARRLPPRTYHPMMSPKKKELPKALVSNVLNVIREKKSKTKLCHLLKHYHDKYGANLNFRPYGFASLKEAISSIDGLKLSTISSDVVVSCVDAAPLMSSSAYDTVRESLCKTITKVLANDEVPLYKFSERYQRVVGRELDPRKYGFSSLLNLMNELLEIVHLRRDNDNGDWLVSHVSTKSSALADVQQTPAKKKIPPELLEMIQEVVKSNSYGIYLANFDETFKLKTGVDLPPNTYGFGSMKALLTEVTNESIEIISAKFGLLIRVKPGSEQSSPSRQNTNRPMLDITQDIHDAVGPGVSYNRAIQPPIDQYIVLMVSQVYNPSSFFVQLLPNDNAGKRLEELMDLLEEVYNPLEDSRSYQLPAMFAVPRQLVVCRFPNDTHWHRARITKVIDANFVQVIFVDYGTRCSILKNNLFYLRQQFLVLPEQAQLATLFGISPANGDIWSAAASKAFLNLTSDKRLCAVVKTIDRDQKLSVCLTDTTTEVDIHINDYLVTSEFATFHDLSAEVPRQNSAKVDEMLNWSLSSGDETDTDDEAVSSKPASKQLTAPSQSTEVPLPVESQITKPIDSTPSSLPMTSPNQPTQIKSTCSLNEEPDDVPEGSAKAQASPLTNEILSSKTTVTAVVADAKPSTNNAATTETNSLSTRKHFSSTGPPALKEVSTPNAVLPPASHPPFLMSLDVIPQLVETSNNVRIRMQQTTTVRPQMNFPNRFSQPRPSHVHRPNQQYQQNMMYPPQSAMFGAPPMMMPPVQFPVFGPYGNFNQPYMVPPRPFYPMHMSRPYYQPDTQLRPTNCPVSPLAPSSAYNNARGNGMPPLEPVNYHSIGANLSAGRGDAPQSMGRNKSLVRQEMPPLADIVTGETLASQVDGARNRQPPQIVENSRNLTDQEKVEQEGPPPLVQINAVGTGNSVSQHSGEVGRPDHATTFSAKHLEYKLAGLQLKRKRIKRQQLEIELADYSGAESSDSELSTIDHEINICKDRLTMVAGDSSGSILETCGRGRGRLHLMALASND